MIRWEEEDGGWQGYSGELAVANVAKEPDAEDEQWSWTVTAVKRPKGWRKGSGHRGTWLEARRAAEEYWARWLAEAALRPDIGRLAANTLAAEEQSRRRLKRPRSG